jgi:hypothetical protein
MEIHKGNNIRELLFNSKETIEKLGLLVSSFFLCKLTIFHSKFVPEKAEHLKLLLDSIKTSQITIRLFTRTECVRFYNKAVIYACELKMATELP